MHPVSDWERLLFITNLESYCIVCRSFFGKNRKGNKRAEKEKNQSFCESSNRCWQRVMHVVNHRQFVSSLAIAPPKTR